jgi:hypothetical protein
MMRGAVAQVSEMLGLKQDGIAADLEEIAGPAVKKAASLLKMGQGVLYYCPEAAAFQDE